DPFPTRYNLDQNYPNPFNPGTNISFQILEPGYVTLKVYDLLGRELATLVNEEKIRGNYEIPFNGSGFSSGLYFYILNWNNSIQTKKMLLIK
ncbi:MAG: T9SS type A sorting domain-containing protein, partial [Melioribacteraceae bacterium]